MLSPRLTGKLMDMNYFKITRSILKKALTDLEIRLSKTAFLCGEKQTIADLSAACELD